MSSSTNQVEIISTSPSPLDGATILPGQDITINFNKPLENAGQLKIRFDPAIDYQVKLSNDRKTATITAPFELGKSYTLFILGESKFDGALRLGGDKVFHFKTIDFKSG